MSTGIMWAIAGLGFGIGTLLMMMGSGIISNHQENNKLLRASGKLGETLSMKGVIFFMLCVMLSFSSCFASCGIVHDNMTCESEIK